MAIKILRFSKPIVAINGISTLISYVCDLAGLEINFPVVSAIIGTIDFATFLIVWKLCKSRSKA